jgi:hypothetical protein
MEFELVFNFVAFSIPALIFCDALVRVSSPGRYRSFLAWLNRGKPYNAEAILPSDRQIRFVGFIMLFFSGVFLWLDLSQMLSGGIQISQTSHAAVPGRISYLSFLFGLGLVAAGVASFFRPRVLRKLLIETMMGLKVESAEADILRGVKMFAGTMVFAGTVLVVLVILNTL